MFKTKLTLNLIIILIICGLLLTNCDIDEDGIPDLDEMELIKMYSPYYFFDAAESNNNDDFRPAGPLWYIKRSELLTSGDEESTPYFNRSELNGNPQLVLQANQNGIGSSNITENPQKTRYHINPLANINGEENNAGRHGESWEYVLEKKNVGLYAHVVQVQEPYLRGQIQNPNLYKYYKIEYWQFFGFNQVDNLNTGDHEGEWEGVQLLIDPEITDAEDRIVAIIHMVHGREIRFTTEFITGEQISGQIKILEGPNFRKQFSSGSTATSLSSTAQNNEVRFYYDAKSGKYTHPVVYIEEGTHAFWPTQEGGWIGAGNHSGNGHFYLTQNIPNLGEVETPFSIYFEPILQFNGYWGAYSRSLPGIYECNPAVGPILHTEWTWPANSTLRSQIDDNDFAN